MDREIGVFIRADVAIAKVTLYTLCGDKDDFRRTKV